MPRETRAALSSTSNRAVSTRRSIFELTPGLAQERALPRLRLDERERSLRARQLHRNRRRSAARPDVDDRRRRPGRGAAPQPAAR